MTGGGLEELRGGTNFFLGSRQGRGDVRIYANEHLIFIIKTIDMLIRLHLHH